MHAKGHYLKGALGTEEYATLRDAVTAGWDPGFVADPANKPAVDDVVFRRHDNTLRFVVPWVESVRPLADSPVIDFGCGCGSSSLAFARYSPEVVGFEIDEPSVDAFKTRMEVAGCRNAVAHRRDPGEILEAALASMRPGVTVLLLAVVEHLTERERLEFLSRFWRELAPGDLLVVAETPNYYAFFDGHTFGLPFTHTIPDEYFERWLRRQEEGLRFRDDLLRKFETEGPEAALEQRRRLGMGVDHHVFEMAFETELREVVAADGFCPEIIDWFPVSGDDRRLVGTFAEFDLDLPIGFARSVLSFVFRKPRTTAEARKQAKWNAKQRNRVIRRFAA